LNQPPRSISPQAIDNLKQYRFPGNLRELRNLIERAYILSSDGEIGAEHFPVPQGAAAAAGVAGNGHKPATASVTTPAADSFDLTGFLEQTEKDLIVRTLSATGGAQAEAARRMGLSRSALAYKLNKYGIRTTAE